MNLRYFPDFYFVCFSKKLFIYKVKVFFPFEFHLLITTSPQCNDGGLVWAATDCAETVNRK